jgi:hypothetical protein
MDAAAVGRRHGGEAMLQTLRRWFRKHFDESAVARDTYGRFTPVQILPSPSRDPMAEDQSALAREENAPPALLQIPFRAGFAPRPLGERSATDWLQARAQPHALDRFRRARTFPLAWGELLSDPELLCIRVNMGPVA